MALQNTSFSQIGDGNPSNVIMKAQGAATDLTTTTNLTAAQLATTIINYAGAGHSLTMPLATALDTALPNFPINSSFDFSVIAVGGTATLVTNTGWTIVGSLLTVDATAAMFRARKTAAGAWTLYRVA